jgi:hypothetical protein
LIAAQVVLAITATPPSGMNLAGAGVAAISTIFSTPGTFIAAALSTLLSFPPNTGGRAITAYLRPGSFTSML